MKSQEAKWRCFCGKLQNNPRSFPLCFRGRPASRFHIPEGKEPCFQRHFFLKNPNDFSRTRRNDGVGLMGNSELSRIHGRPGWPSSSRIGLGDGFQGPLQRSLGWNRMPSPFGGGVRSIDDLEVSRFAQKFFSPARDRLRCLIYGKVSYRRLPSPRLLRQLGRVGTANRLLDCLLRFRRTNFPGRRVGQGGRNRFRFDGRLGGRALFFFHGIAKDRPVIESIIGNQTARHLEWVAPRQTPYPIVGRRPHPDGHLQIMSDQIANHGLTVFMLLRNVRTESPGRGNKTKLQQELGRTERFNAFLRRDPGTRSLINLFNSVTRPSNAMAPLWHGSMKVIHYKKQNDLEGEPNAG